MANIYGVYGSDFAIGTYQNDYIQTFEIPNFRGGGDRERASVNEQGWDFVLAYDGNDTIHTGGGNDWIDAGNGNDVIAAGTGIDTMWGGAGNDIFNFSPLMPSPGAHTNPTGNGAFNRDVILDFTQGQDRMDLGAWVNFYSGYTGVDFVGQQGGSSAIVAGPNLTVAYHYEGGNTVVDLGRFFFGPDTPQAQLTGQIELAGIHALTPSDFIW